MAYHPVTMTRSSLVLVPLLVAAGLVLPQRGAAQEIAVPLPLQATLLVKAAALDWNLPARAGARVNLVIVEKAGIADSHRAALQLKAALETQQKLAGLPLAIRIATFVDAPKLAVTCRDERVSILHFSSGFESSEIRAIAEALAGGDVLSVAAVAADVQEGIVLGFDLVSGKPKILANLKQARRQNVQLASGLLSVAQVYR